jgi:hypothetical protein
VDNAIAQKDVSQPLFTAYLGSWRDTDEPDKGEVSLVSLHVVNVSCADKNGDRASTLSALSTKIQ